MPGRYGPLSEFLEAIRDAGVTHILCLVSHEEIAEKSPDYLKAIRSNGIPASITRFDIPDYGLPDDPDELRTILHQIRKRLDDSESVVIHCAGGHGRTGMVATLLLMEMGLSIDHAVDLVEAAGSAPDTEAQAEFLEQWQHRSTHDQQPPLDRREESTSPILPLIHENGHIFVKLDGELWLYDTGAPTSFGATRKLSLAGEEFTVSTNYLGLTVTALSRHVGVPCAGLLGGDVLNRFDHILDVANGSLTITTAELPQVGHSVPLEEFMGIPIVPVEINGTHYRMFFDTGAQVSYLQHESLNDFPSVGTVTDFFPGVGQFETTTHDVGVSLGDRSFTLRCGMLPGVLGMTLMMAGVDGILGNEMMARRVIGYFPRRNRLFIS